MFYTPTDTNTWRVNGLGFYFPTNSMLYTNQRALIVATNPAAFRAKYGVPEDVAIFGPFSGRLQDSGERLQLQRPDYIGTNPVSYITLDEVRYNDRAPWPPAADGSGASLQRVNDAAYGDDPINWRAAVPTPGGALAPGSRPRSSRTRKAAPRPPARWSASAWPPAARPCCGSNGCSTAR